MKVACVTGVTGFLGSHLTRSLVRRGWQVHGLKRSASDVSRLRDVAEHVTFHDVDRGPLDGLFEAATPDAVIHLATCYGRQGESPSQVAATNLVYPLALLERASRSGARVFINAATTYTVDYKYLQSYTLSKQQFADWGRLFSPPGMRFVNLRLYHPYGPGDHPSKFVPQLIRSCLDSDGEIKLTRGEQRKDFLHVSDFLAAVHTLLDGSERLPAGFVALDCGSGRAVSIREFVETVHRVTGSQSALRFGAMPYRDNEIMFSQADLAGLRSLGWEPTVSLEQGIRDILREDFGRD
jgi:nucleoside-diphosphate-sugar epimerase